MNACSVDDCDRKAHAKGYCNAHYRRLIETGDVDAGRPLMRMSPGLSWQEKLDLYSAPSEGGCVVWTGSTADGGYGQLRADGRKQRVHRLAYTRAHGDLAPGTEVDHKCGNRACLNPDHLRAVTRGENAQYMVRLNRRNTSGYRGVFRTPQGRWRATAVKDGKRFYIGLFDTAKEAGEAAATWRSENYELGEFSG